MKKANYFLLISVAILVVVPPAAISPILNLVNPKFNSYLQLVSIGRFIGTIALFLPFFALSTFCLWHYNNRFHLIRDKVSDSIASRIPLIIQLIQFSNFTIIPQYFARDFWRLSMNLSFFSLAYLSICMYYGWNVKYNDGKVVLSKIYLYMFFVFVFYFLFLMLNGGEYMDVIRKTIESNTVFNYFT